jgi:hypothetical protein
MIKYYSLFLLSVLLLMGCSSTYTINDFSSKDKFYQSFNSSVGYKDIDITLNDKSQRTIYGGGTLKQDTLYTLTDIFPVETIKNIKYRTKGGGGSVPIGILSGSLIGGIAAASTVKSLKKVGDWGPDYEVVYLIYMAPAAIIGGIIGYFIGWNTIYQFNP